MRSTKLQVDRDAYIAKRNHYNLLNDNTRTAHYRETIVDAPSSKDKWKACNKLFGKSEASSLPAHESEVTLANDFNTFFTEKIVKIREELEQSSVDCPPHVENARPIFNGKVWSEFRPVTEAEVEKVIKSSPSTSCPLDPLPTRILKACLSSLLTVLTFLVNLSLSTGEFCSTLKKAFVTPLLKKCDLDFDVFKNYRPVSNLSFVSKLIERIVAIQLLAHLTANNIMEKFQSAYRAFHSTETALLRVLNDLLLSVDSHGGAILVLLDLSAAFDTIDHATLLNALQSQCGITGTVLKWFTSYLADRLQAVRIGEAISDFVRLVFGVPQGSVLGPILFTLYTSPLGVIVRRHGLLYHFYADDSQLYIVFKTKDHISIDDATAKVEASATNIRAWMNKHFLKLNEDKTELLVITTKRTTPVSEINIKIGSDTISPANDSDPPRNLGVFLDSSLSLDFHISKMVKAINFALFNIGKIRKYLDKSTCAMLINGLMMSRLDNCNSLLNGVPAKSIKPLQLLQNRAARILTFTPKFNHITPVMHELHWLPVDRRIEFKILLFCYKCLNGLAPPYLSELLSRYVPARSLRSADKDLLTVPSISAKALKTFGSTSFTLAGPRLWNDLPREIRGSGSLEIFKKRLKTHLFKLAYE